MIGQKANLEIVKHWRLNMCVPRTILIHGKGERLELAKSIAGSMNYNIVSIDKSVISVRDMLNDCYRNQLPVFYVFEDGDNMSAAATNAILKVIEEPPTKSYFIVLAEDVMNILPTIRSRSAQLETDEYCIEELKMLTDDENLLHVFRWPEDILKWKGREQEFKLLKNKAKNHIKILSSLSKSDALKILSEINPDDIQDFIVVSKHELLKLSGLGFEKVSRICFKTSKALKTLKKAGIKKESVFDDWILRMQEIIKEEK